MNYHTHCITYIISILHAAIPAEDLTGSLQEDDFRLYLEKKSNRCTQNPPITCTDQKIFYDDPPSGNITSNTPDDTSTLDASNATQGTNNTEGDDISDSVPQGETDDPSPSDSHSIVSRNTGDMDDEGATDDTNSGGATLSTAAIAFIAIGAVFFVVLVILVIILCACLYPRNSQKKTFVPAAPLEEGSK